MGCIPSLPPGWDDRGIKNENDSSLPPGISVEVFRVQSPASSSGYHPRSHSTKYFIKTFYKVFL